MLERNSEMCRNKCKKLKQNKAGATGQGMALKNCNMKVTIVQKCLFLKTLHVEIRLLPNTQNLWD